MSLVTLEKLVNRSLHRRQRAHLQGEKDTKWNLLELSNISSSTDQESVTLNSSEDIFSTSGRRDGVFHRLNERLSALVALDEQQSKHLESLEYRFTKLEVQSQERAENIRSELREISRRVQQLDWQSSKVESLLDTLKEDTTFLRQSFDQLRSTVTISSANTNLKYIANEALVETQNKFQILQMSVQVIRSSIVDVSNEISLLKLNVSKIANSTSEILTQTKQLPTTKLLNTKFLESRSLARGQEDVCTIEHQRIGEEQWSDCWDIFQNGQKESGIYKIRPSSSTYSFYVYCEMQSNDGGWTVLQNRHEGASDFYKDWQEYKLGFGNLLGEFWLGLRHIHAITRHKLYELLIELKDHEGNKVYASYDSFAIGSQEEGYALKILGKYTGNAGDSLVYHAGQKFSTMDVDNDNWLDGNCAVSHTGAWWYNGCDTSNLNGRYLNGDLPEDYNFQGIYWYDWHGPNYSLMETRMSIRPRDRPTFQIQATTYKSSSPGTMD
ncbi:fibrinogen-like protein 1 isoform X2 [Cephus cinctus]|uniref:Fibrinogen-like protein 1 isoform X2 n=1 Tax=Cephus cinctus TaxID=211228 RepID=A0AAJ7W4L9_CEPCN|nr:fibrinogen-like protein 1 isoform X2 [Cephus cinctus]